MVSEDDYTKLSTFLGYGNRNADIWFLGMEESAKDKYLKKNIEARLKFDEVMDLRAAHDKEYLNFPYWETSQEIPEVWKWMARIALGLYSDDFSSMDWLNNEAKIYQYTLIAS